MWKADTMSIHDDSSTVLSVRGSDAGHVADSLIQAEKQNVTALPDFYGKSPYTDADIIALDVGLAKTRYRIHRSVLAQSPELASKPALKLWGEKTNDTVALPDLDAVTAHTLVAFLYTGRYETLEWLGEEDKKKVAAYKLAACVYCAATRYKIPGLAALAQDGINAAGRDLTILDVLGVARDHAFPILPDDETWFAEYLEDAIKRAAADDPGLFVKPGFVEQIEGDRRFRQVVMRAIVGTYAAGGGIGGGDDPPMDAPTGEAEAVGGGADVVAELQHTAAVNGDIEDEVQLEDIEPSYPDSPVHRPASPGSPAAPESVTDELDFKNSKMYQSMGKPVSHVRHDSAVQTDVVQAEKTPSVVDGKEEKEVASPAADVASPASEVVIANGTTSSGKKKNKKSKKKSGTVFA
ncbi:hypothetical protein P171DRAFT_266391 [Karstenula rhodostoma CBS 690.94]|uniref:BTB domain-containing protein n=1 Tax=Karstenula rhodostoma CBS 690.94 TaxID=1392251 RepID=A0A9P4PLT9_9PLEO|nr:hypothetical protein P171DRAFT_266391 [Karstenula rhodostoma CBS 690.94]